MQEPELFDDKNDIRVRMAPSPTGALHVGTARTALFNYIFAQKYGGEFLLRIEDTDRERSDKKWEEDIVEGLKWLMIDWDGDPVYQSKRTDIYQKYINNLLDEDKAFYCWHTKEELQEEKQRQMENKEAPRHICEYRDQKTEDPDTIERSIIRLKNDAKDKIKFYDFVRGYVEFEGENLGDFSIAKSIDRVLYNFAVTVDDHEAEITHIIRGEDHISNTPKQILIQEAIGARQPKYIHLPLILGPDKSKLSKRHGATSVSEYREMGYLPDAMFNFLSLLGWHPPDDEKELMPSEEIIKEFEVKDIQQAGAVFDTEKLNWMNGNYIRNLSSEDFAVRCLPYLQKAGFVDSESMKYQVSSINEIQNSKFETELYGKRDFEWIKKVVSMEQERVQNLSEIPRALDFVFKEPDYELNLLFWKKMEVDELREIFSNLHVIIQEIEDNKWNKEDIESIIMPQAEMMGDRGKMLWPLRAALTGKKASPGPFEVLEVIGKENAIKRINTAKEKLGSL